MSYSYLQLTCFTSTPHNTMKHLLTTPLFLCLMAWLPLGLQKVQADTITSPNGSIVANVTISGGNLVYSVTFNGVTVIETSRLGLTVNGSDLGAGVTITGGTSASGSYNFASRHGVHATASGSTQGRTINVRHNATGRNYITNVSVRNDGLAIRYEFVGSDSKNVTAEATSFVLPANTTIYYQTNTSVYEGSFGGTNVSSVADNTSLGSPVTAKLPSGSFLSITQSALTNVGVFPNPYLFKAPSSTGRQLQVAYPVNANGSRGVTMSSDIKSPWNVIMIGDLNTLVNADIVESMTPPPSTTLFPQGAATPWCKPGRSVWDWLYKYPGGVTAANAIVANDYAGRLGWEYNTVDLGWAGWNGGNPWPQVQSVVNDANSRGVHIILWKDARDLATQSQRTAFFQLLKNNGVAGFKADFFDFNSVSASARERVQLLRDILQEAAGFQLVVNCHGISKPFGLFKTYPNLLQVEAVYGKELFAGPTNYAVQPFTRFLAGPADFTPMALQGSYKGSRTTAYEIASVVTMPGPIITFAERSDNIYNSPFRDVIQFIPSMWDETRVLSQSDIGNVVAMARRKGSEWYLAITNKGSTRSWTIPLSFLSSGTYTARAVRDGATAIQTTSVNSGTGFSVTAQNEGGIAVRFTPQ
jgi:hypothetical protein